jgi:phage N-6-adenine-methyltransferase
VSKLSDEWQTPQWLFDQLNEEFNFDIDLCASETNRKCLIFCQNYLSLNWGISDVVGFLNPPYSNPYPFISRAIAHAKRGATIVALVKCDPSTKWWALFWDYEKHQPKPGIEVRFLPKRVKFDPPPGFKGKTTSPAFATAIVIFRAESRTDKESL